MSKTIYKGPEQFREWRKRFRETNPEGYRTYSRKMVIHRHHITPELYDLLLEAQGFKCIGCGKTDENLGIDHNHNCCPDSHSCGSCIRGLLCRKCNLAIAYVNENVETMQNLINYLERHSQPNPEI